VGSGAIGGGDAGLDTEQDGGEEYDDSQRE